MDNGNRTTINEHDNVFIDFNTYNYSKSIPEFNRMKIYVT